MIASRMRVSRLTSLTVRWDRQRASASTAPMLTLHLRCHRAAHAADISRVLGHTGSLPGLCHGSPPPSRDPPQDADPLDQSDRAARRHLGAIRELSPRLSHLPWLGEYGRVNIVGGDIAFVRVLGPIQVVTTSG